MSIPLLPSLNNNSKISLTRSGEWVVDTANTLPGLVDSLKVVANKDSDISSIPDVWARPVLVESILMDVAHPKHQVYVDEWRGILGIMAMRKIRGFSKVGMQSYDIPALDKLPKDANAFLRVIARSIPQEYLDKQDDNTLQSGVQAKIQILTYDDKPLAIIWPTTLVCPAVELNTYCADEIPWWDFDGMHDPIKDLSDDEKNALHSWLQQIIDATSEPILMNLLVAFRDDVKNALGNNFAKDTSLPQSIGDLRITGAGQCLNQAIVGIADKNFLKKSQVRLMKQRDKGDIPEILLMAPDLDTQWNVNASDIIVGGYINASTCMHKGSGVILEDEHKYLGEVNLEDYNAEFHMADEFFTDKIAVFNRSYNAFPNILENKVYQYGDSSKVNIVLPIRKRLLDYLEPSYIAQNTTITVINQDIKVQLVLPVVDGEDNIRYITATKIYQADVENDPMKKDSQIIRYNDVPLIQIWPNIKLRQPQKWEKYYSYFDTGDALTDFYASPLFEEKTIDNIRLKEAAATVTVGKNFPEAFTCEQLSKGFNGSLQHVELGLLLLNTSEVLEVNTQNLTCTVGVDFGTTNTTAYLQLAGNEPSLIHLQNRKFYVTKTSEEDRINRYDDISVRKNFISEQEQPGKVQSSIKTVYHENPERTVAFPFFSGNIYYIDQSRDIYEDEEFARNLKTNDMKWGSERGNISQQGFLMQLSLQCLVEAVCAGANDISFKYSYPKAFSPTKFEDYSATWDKVYEFLKKACTLTIQEPKSLSESESVAEYFQEENDASTERGFFCVDIGGGSTDLAVWQKKDDSSHDGLVNQTSFKFAGRDILNEYLWNRQQNGHSIFLRLKNDNEEFNSLLKKLDEQKSRNIFDLMLEALLRDYEADIFKSLPAKHNDTEISLLMRDITFALSGIFFYCGMLIGYLRKNGEYEDRKSVV